MKRYAGIMAVILGLALGHAGAAEPAGRATTDHDVDGDGKADPAVYAASGGMWKVLLSGSGYAIGSVVLGGRGAQAVAADYDGDGRTDPAVFLPEDGLWTVLLSGSHYTRVSMRLGAAGCLPVPADYDGDGRTEPAFFKPSALEWGSSASGPGNAGTRVVFGAASGLPVPADYDGDGRSDPAYFVAYSGTWGMLLSGSGYAPGTFVFGTAGCTPVPADYDGDGRADPAVYHVSSGTWYARLSGSGYAAGAVSLGAAGCLPVPADYDGDGRADPAVYQATNASWIALLSGSGYARRSWMIGGPDFVPAYPGWGREAQSAEVLPLFVQGKAEKADRYQYAVEQGVRFVPTSDGRSFYILWYPATTNPAVRPPMVVTLHGHGSWAFDGFYLWHPYLAQRGYGIIALQWWFGQGETSPDYYSPDELFGIFDAALREQGVRRETVLLDGFSRGAANTYGVTAYDRYTGTCYFLTTLAISGKPGADFPVNVDIAAGRFGLQPFAGTHWVMYGGALDPNPDRDGIPGMREARTWVVRYGGVVDLLIEDPVGDHGGFHRSPANVNAALDVFARRLAGR